MNNDNFAVRIIIGGFLILLGLSIFLDQIGLNPFGFNIFNLWPLLLVAFGLWMLVKRNFFAAMGFLFFGVAFLISTIFGYSIFQFFWPLIIIFIGLSMLFRPGKNWFNGNEGYSNSVLNKDRLNEDIIFWGADFNVKSENFSGGSIDAVFGGFKLDLREAKLSEGNSTLEVNAVFGGGEIIVPKDMRVEVETSAFMGGVTNQTSNSAVSGSTLKIKATAVFGGIEIKN